MNHTIHSLSNTIEEANMVMLDDDGELPSSSLLSGIGEHKWTIGCVIWSWSMELALIQE